jgi:hypothetical protein
MITPLDRNEQEAVLRVIPRPPAVANLVLDSADRYSSTSVAREGFTGSTAVQPYNNFKLQKPANMMDGLFTRLTLSEIMFPYAIPNVTPYNSSFYFCSQLEGPDAGVPILVEIDPGFYTPSQLVAAINAAFVALWDGLVDQEPPTVNYTEQTNQFTILPNQYTVDAALVDDFIAIIPYNTFTPAPGPDVPISSIQFFSSRQSLLDTMGFNYRVNPAMCVQFNDVGPTGIVSGFAKMSYTRFIDITSNKLTYFSNVKDTQTWNEGKGNVICRIYVADEISFVTQTIPAGVTPFTMHRQFKNPKTFKWNDTAFLDFIDLQLWDDCGNPLYTPPSGLPEFQITFLASED